MKVSDAFSYLDLRDIVAKDKEQEEEEEEGVKVLAVKVEVVGAKKIEKAKTTEGVKKVEPTTAIKAKESTDVTTKETNVGEVAKNDSLELTLELPRAPKML